MKVDLAELPAACCSEGESPRLSDDLTLTIGELTDYISPEPYICTSPWMRTYVGPVV